MKKHKLAACGIDCNECGSYKVTMKNDMKSAEDLVWWYRNMGWIERNEGAEAVIKKNPLCRGCWNTKKDDCFFNCTCGSRDFRICCIEKQIKHCGECSDFPCEDYLKFGEDGLEHHKKAMEYLLSLKKTVGEL
jgi:hypothetical protein